MSQQQGKGYEKLSGENDEVPENKSNLFVNSSALVREGDGRVLPIYAVLESRRDQLIQAWAWVLGTVVFYCWTVSFTYTVFISDKPVPHVYDYSPTVTIALVNVASHISVWLTLGLAYTTFDTLRWAMASRARGVSLKTFIATNQDTGIFSLGSLSFTYGPHQKWCIIRFSILIIGWIIGLLLLSNVKTKNVYNRDKDLQVIAGLAPLHDSVAALNNTFGISSTSIITPGEINILILGLTHGILTDPTLVAGVPPLYCKGDNCKSLFLPGGMELVRRPDGSTLASGQQLTEPVLIVHDAPGYQLEFSPANFTFDSSTDCDTYGLPVSMIYACVAYSNNALFAGECVSISAPPNLMSQGSCQSDLSWAQVQDVASMSVYQRNATVAYNTANFSILSIESIGPPVNATNQEMTVDFKAVLGIMYPRVTDILSDALTLLSDPSKLLPILEDWGSAYCVQAELTSAVWVLQNGFPTWATGTLDVLEGFLTIPIQFGTVLWQFANFSSLPPSLKSTAYTAQVSYRARTESWTLMMFAVLSLSLIVWAISCLLYIHYVGYGDSKGQLSQTIQAAFRNGNPFDAKAKGEVVARTLSNKVMIAVDPVRTLKEEESPRFALRTAAHFESLS